MQAANNIIRESFELGVPSLQKLDILIKLYGESALSEILLSLDDEDVLLRAIALVYLGEMGDRRAVAPIIQFMSDESRYDHYRPRHARLPERLVTILSPWMHDLPLQVCLTDRVIDLRAAALALGLLGSADALEALQALCHHPDEKVRETVVTAIARVSGG